MAKNIFFENVDTNFFQDTYKNQLFCPIEQQCRAQKRQKSITSCKKTFFLNLDPNIFKQFLGEILTPTFFEIYVKNQFFCYTQFEKILSTLAQF